MIIQSFLYSNAQVQYKYQYQMRGPAPDMHQMFQDLMEAQVQHSRRANSNTSNAHMHHEFNSAVQLNLGTGAENFLAAGCPRKLLAGDSASQAPKKQCPYTRFKNIVRQFVYKSENEQQAQSKKMQLGAQKISSKTQPGCPKDCKNSETANTNKGSTLKQSNSSCRQSPDIIDKTIDAAVQIKQRTKIAASSASQALTSTLAQGYVKSKQAIEQAGHSLTSYVPQSIKQGAHKVMQAISEVAHQLKDAVAEEDHVPTPKPKKSEEAAEKEMSGTNSTGQSLKRTPVNIQRPPKQNVAPLRRILPSL